MKSTKTSKLIVFKIYHYHIASYKYCGGMFSSITQKTLKLSSRKFPYNTLRYKAWQFQNHVMMNHENWFRSWKFSTTECRSYTVYDMYKIWQQPVTPCIKESKSVTIKASLQVLKRLQHIAILLYICMPKD